MKQKPRISLRVKLLFFATALALITYGTSGFFIFILYDKIEQFLPFSFEAFTMITLFLGVFWSGVLAYAAAIFIIKPLQKLEDAAGRAAKGDISKEADISNANDEISSLGLAFNTMLVNLRSIVLNIEENFQETNHSVEKIKTAAAEAEKQANMIAQTIEEIAAGAGDSSAAVLQTVQAVDESNRLAGEVQAKANHSYVLFEEMQQTLESSKAVIKDLIASIQKLSEEQMDSLTDVKQLEKDAVKIEEIITLVGEIADQTNLLALNASIEAARAGEHGRGFAVVADQIRKLADESARAVGEISELVTAIQQDIGRTVKKIQSQADDARKEAEKGEEASTAVEQVSVSVEQMVEAVAQITELIIQQRQNMEQTYEQTQEVAAISQQTTAGTEEVSAAIQQQNAMIQEIYKIAVELEKQAQKLNEQIHQFCIKEE